jgi:hypothetical protein
MLGQDLERRREEMSKPKNRLFTVDEEEIIRLVRHYRITEIVLLSLQAYEHAQKKHRDIASGHEGYAVIKEELEELWDEVKHDNVENFAKEALQVAAMGMRFCKDVCGMEDWMNEVEEEYDE